ncbi:MAG: hypothetical protein QM777_02100 [Pseudorhodoferax sp.]
MPASKKPPTKPASMMTGCARSAAQTPRRPTWASCASSAGGTRGISRLTSRPAAMQPMATQGAAGASAPTQTRRAGPVTKVAPTMVSNRPTLRPRVRAVENSATSASDSTQRRPEAAPASISSANQAGRLRVEREAAAGQGRHGGRQPQRSAGARARA